MCLYTTVCTCMCLCGVCVYVVVCVCVCVCVCVFSLLQSGVDVNCRHPLGWTALHTAVMNGQHKYMYMYTMIVL